MRLGLSINKIYKITPGSTPEPEGGTFTGTQIAGQAGIIYYTETVGGVTTNYEAPAQTNIISVILGSGGSVNPPLYNLDNDASQRTSITELLGYISNGAITISGTTYSNWELLTIPANTPENIQNDIILGYLEVTDYTSAETNILLKIGNQYNVANVIQRTPTVVQYNLIPLTFNSNGYIVSDVDYILYPAIVRSYNPAIVVTTKVPLLLSAMYLVDSTSTTGALVPQAFTSGNILEYFSVLEQDGGTTDINVMQQSNRYPVSNTYLNPFNTPAGTYPGGTVPPDNTKHYPLPGQINATITTSNSQISVIVNSYTAQAPPAPWYSASNPQENVSNLTLKTFVVCFGNSSITQNQTQSPLGGVYVTSLGTTVSVYNQNPGRFYVAWRFNIPLADLNIFPTTVNGVTTYSTVQSKSFNGTEGTFKSGVFMLFNTSFIANGFLESTAISFLRSGFTVSVPLFTGGGFEQGQDLSLFLDSGTSTASTTVINKNRTTANAISIAIPTPTASNDTNGLRPLITG